MSINFDLEVTPDAEVQIIFDPKVGDIMKGRGSGNLKMEVNTLGTFKIYGDYKIEEGDYLFTLQNVINKRFKVEQGGLIEWNGDPEDAIVDVKQFTEQKLLYTIFLLMQQKNIKKEFLLNASLL